MDTTASKTRSEGLGIKRLLEKDELSVNLAKKARCGDGDLEGDLRKVAEIVMVLATIGKMRGGMKATEVELDMMVKAREKLGKICVEFAPNDVFNKDVFECVIEDLGLKNRVASRIHSKMSIADKLLLAKQKMAKSEDFSKHRATYRLAGTNESGGTTHVVRMSASDKPCPAPPLSRSVQHPSNLVHAPPANSTSLPYQTPTREVKPVAPSVLPTTHLRRDSLPSSSSSAVPRVDSAQLRLDARSNGFPYASPIQASSSDHPVARPITRSMQLPSTSRVEVGHNKVPVHISIKAEDAADANMSSMAAQATMSRPITTQSTPSNMSSTRQHLQEMNYDRALNHNDICKIVQKIIHPQLLEKQTWTPPSRDYINNSMACQMCNISINEVETVLVCDACENCYHLRCLNLNSEGIPDGDWHCGNCLTLSNSNGKPLPPKYGRVMRNIKTQKIVTGTTF